MRRIGAVAALSFALALGARAEEGLPGPPLPVRTPPPQRFRLFRLPAPAEHPPLDLEPVQGNRRLFHQPGDADSLFTVGAPSPEGEIRLRAAVEVNEVILRAIAPDLRIDPGDTRPRAAGDYRALDAGGRPYQFRLGARLVW